MPTSWSDAAAPDQGGPDNPPGLGHEGRRALDRSCRRPGRSGIRAASSAAASRASRPPYTYGAGLDRVRHAVLNKDTGRIDRATGAAGPGETPRGAAHGNFERAVAAAIADTRNAFAHFEAETLRVYGPERGALILCAVKADDRRTATARASAAACRNSCPEEAAQRRGRVFEASLHVLGRLDLAFGDPAGSALTPSAKRGA